MENKLHRDLLKIRKTTCKAKTPPGDFKVITLKNPLINNQEITSIRKLTTTIAYTEILTYSWTLTPIPNWTWSCSIILSLDAQISNLWLTFLHESPYMANSSKLNECCWLQSYSLYQQLRSASTWLQNHMVYICSNISQRKINSCSLYPCGTTLKISLIYV